jgi:hypothetical protein
MTIERSHSKVPPTLPCARPLVSRAVGPPAVHTCPSCTRQRIERSPRTSKGSGIGAPLRGTLHPRFHPPLGPARWGTRGRNSRSRPRNSKRQSHTGSSRRCNRNSRPLWRIRRRFVAVRTGKYRREAGRKRGASAEHGKLFATNSGAWRTTRRTERLASGTARVRRFGGPAVPCGRGRVISKSAPVSACAVAAVRLPPTGRGNERHEQHAEPSAGSQGHGSTLFAG